MEGKILVVGSANIDMVVKTERFPEAGETLLGGEFFKFSGGKGANQAVAAARLDGDVTFISKLGDDEFGRTLINLYEQEGINTNYILLDDHHPTGVALISVNGEGENKIVVAPGANKYIKSKEIENYKKVISRVDVILLQLEIPIEIVGQIIELAKKHDVKVILNPAPARELPKSYLEDLFLISPNENEIEKITGLKIKNEDEAKRAAKKLHNLGVHNVVITLGRKGAFLSTKDYTGYISTLKVKAVDTTAAGDIFNGALAVAIMKEHPWQEAVEFACRAAAVSVSRNGAQSSAPTMDELQNFQQSSGS